ncbi:MAG: DUF402 domain-containing protein [Chloroflexota bacterium]|nr:DUF402 domain-containing protein [Chloroflexota bacterium]
MAEPMRAGDAVNVVVFNLSGTRRRWWTSTIEAVDNCGLRTFSRRGNPVGGPKGGWASQADIRAFYWFDRPYNLLESYDAAGALSEIYVHIASPAQFVDGELHYTDYELDVARRTGEQPIVLDEDEFEHAVTALGLTPEFRSACYRTIDEVTALAESWVSYGHPEELSPPATRDETFEGKSRRLGVRSPIRADAKNRGAHFTVRNLRPVE